MHARIALILASLAILAAACGYNPPRRDDDEDDRRSRRPPSGADDDAPGGAGGTGDQPTDPSDDPPSNGSDDPDDPTPPQEQTRCQAQGVGPQGTCEVDDDGTISALTCSPDGFVDYDYCGSTQDPETGGCVVKGGRAQCIPPYEVDFMREEPWFLCVDQETRELAYTLVFVAGAALHIAPDETVTEGTYEFAEGSQIINVTIPGRLDDAGFVLGRFDIYGEVVLDMYGDGIECRAGYYESTEGLDTDLLCEQSFPELGSTDTIFLDFDPWGAFTVTMPGVDGAENAYGAYFIEGSRVVAAYYATETTKFELEFNLVGGELTPVNLWEAYRIRCD